MYNTKAQHDAAMAYCREIKRRLRAAAEAPRAEQVQWIEHWEGSGDRRGWSIVERRGLRKGDHVAYLGPSVDSEQVTVIVFAHNASLAKPTEAAPTAFGEMVRAGMAKIDAEREAAPVEPLAWETESQNGRFGVFLMPDLLHEKTGNLVASFARAVADKLAAAQSKYGYSDGWMRDDWLDECRAHLRHHVEKGDPRDVAAYCAFLWYHKASTADANHTDSAARQAYREVTLDDARKAADVYLAERDKARPFSIAMLAALHAIGCVIKERP